jgi:hypothetical protein
MTCRQVDDLLDDCLASGAGALVAAHLACCRPCVEHVRSYQRATRLAREAWRDAAEPAVPEALVRAVVERVHAA